MEAPACLTVAVRALCEFAARRGDLDLRFTPSPTAQEGIVGHRTVAQARSGTYRSEVTLEGRHRHLRVRGRADGYDSAHGLVEEVKTFRGDLDRMPANHRHLHWAQAKVYGWLVCAREALPEATVSLVYFDVARQVESPPLTERCTAAELKAFFEDLCERYLAWAEREAAHRVARDAALETLAFPHAAFRANQRELATAVFNAARSGRVLMAQAPTGIGKTVATLFPMLKAMPRQRIDKLFFLTAKGSGSALALDAMATVEAGRSVPLRVIELVARDKACEHPDRQCHGQSCPLAAGFYDRLPDARLAVLTGAATDRAAVRAVALAHGVCPYYLAQELVRWSDVVVADYNYWFDVSALLHAWTVADEWRVAALVDEAHNLVERGREMYSATLTSAQLNAARALAPGILKLPLDRVHRALGRVTQSQEHLYAVHASLPRPLVTALEEATEAIGTLHEGGTVKLDPELQRFYFDALHFLRLAETFGSHSMFDVALAPPEGLREKRHRSATLCIRNVVPAPFLKPRLAALQSGVLFSATLTPQPFYADMLGLPANAAWLDVDAPFRAEQLAVRVVTNVSTRYPHRARSLAPIVDLMARQYAQRPGNYLAFFGSHDYMQRAAAAFVEAHADVPTWMQQRAMDADERAAFLARFSHTGRGIAFAVLGGSFAEGIDLVGTRLVGAFVATLGMPQVNDVNEEMKRRVAERFGAGFEYTYLFPGIRKVVQAAGRVIRTTTDQGTVHLIDDRFAQPDVMALLPKWWDVERVRA